MSSRNYGALRDAATAVKFLERITAKGEPFSFDIEAGYTGEDKVGVSLQQFHPDYTVTGVSFTSSVDWARYIPFDHDSGGNVDDLVAVLRALWIMLQTGMGIAHNASYELKGLSRLFRKVLWNDPVVGADVRAKKGMFPILADTMIMVWMMACYDPIRVGKDLKSVAKAAFDMDMTHFEDLFPFVDSDLGPAIKKGKIRFARFNTRNSYSPKVIEYACEDSVAALMVFLKFIDDLKSEMIYRAEMALIPVLVEMEAGPIDENGNATGNMFFFWSVVRAKAAEVKEFGELMGEEIQDELGRRLNRTVAINLNSPKQLADVLYTDKPEGLGLPIKMRSEKTGAPSTSDDALKVIAKSDPIIKQILEYRQVVKLHGSYLNKFIEELDYAGTGFVFPNHNQAGALTGRMSVDQVSYQQWPKPYHFELRSGRTFDLNFRDLFIAPEHFRIVGFDYANVEMRIAGAMSGEHKIIDAFNKGLDLHKSTASATFKVPLEDVTKKQRGSAKTLNFAILYGSGAGNISEMLTTPLEPVTKEDAEQMLADYLKGYPQLAEWIANQQAHGREEKVVFTHFRRRFTIWEHYQPKEWIRAKGDRMAVNAPIQGTAADIIKIAMVRVQAAIKKAGWEDLVRLTLTIHDALEFLVHESITTQQVIDLVEPCVNFPIKGFPLEIRADWHEGYQWGAVADVKLDEHKQVASYVMEYELPWTKEAFEWKGDTLHDALDPYYAWEWQQFGISAEFYASRNPDFVLPDRAVTSAPAPVVVGSNDPEEEDPGWFHSEAWHEAHNNPKTATVTMSEMPTLISWEKFKAFLEKHPGFDTVVLETPDGSLTFPTTHKLDASHKNEVSMILGGAALSFYTQADKDAAIDKVLEVIAP